MFVFINIHLYQLIFIYINLYYFLLIYIYLVFINTLSSFGSLGVTSPSKSSLSCLSSSLSSSSSLSFGLGLAFGFAIKPEDHRDFRTLFFLIGLFLAEVEVDAEFRLAKSVLIGTILFVLGSKARFSSGLLSFFVSFFLLSMISYKDNTVLKYLLKLSSSID